MKIGFFCNQTTCVYGASNGIRMQALIWRDALEKLGHEIVLINPWECYEWKTFDVIHCFGYSDSIAPVKELKSRGCKIVISPIIDSFKNVHLYHLSTCLGSSRLRLESPAYKLRKLEPFVDGILARTKHEYHYIKTGFGYPKEKIGLVPLSYRLQNKNVDYSVKEPFCFHMSTITQSRKNVMRLIKAAIKYKFNLVLAGSPGDAESFKPFKILINKYENISYLGFISEDQLVDLYSRAKVFALPSVEEGVGLVALEAAMFGCDIVMTNIGGPKEYYGDNAYLVNPYSVDEIGMAVVTAMSETKQPQLKNYVKNNFSIEKCMEELVRFYGGLK